MNKKICLALLAGAMVFASCSRDSDTVVEDVLQIMASEDAKIITDLDATSQTEWTYFSFSKGEVVSVTDAQNDLSWDVAFNRYHIRTNGGTSGGGKGEVARLEEKTFDNVRELDLNLVYVKDELYTPATRPGATAVEISRNQLISGDIGTETGWWSYTPPVAGSNTPHFVVNNWIYIIKDANGNPYKIQLTSYNNSQTGVSGFITFQYKKASSDNKF